MWYIICAVTLVLYVICDVAGKKHVDRGKLRSTLELIITTSVVAFVCGVVLSLTGLGESGLNPIEIIIAHPLIIADKLAVSAYNLSYILSLCFVGLSVESAFGSASSVFYFIGITAVNLVSGRLSEVGDILSSPKLVFVAVLIVSAVLLPNTELIYAKVKHIPTDEAKSGRRNAVIGVALLVFSAIADSLDSVFTAVVFDGGDVGAVDFISASFLLFIIPIVILEAVYAVRYGKPYLPFSRGSRYAVIHSLTVVTATLLYLVASSMNPVATGIIFIAYPILPMVLSRIFLGEKYTWRQNVCIYAIAAASIMYCLWEYIG